MTDSRRFTRFLTTLLCFICAGSAQAQVTSHALIPNMADGTVSIVDTAGFGLAFPSPIAVGGSPNCTYITADGRFGYTTTVNGGQVVKIDMVTGNVVTSINFPTQVVCLAVSPDETTGYVTDMDQGVVHVVDLATDSDTGISINVGTSIAAASAMSRVPVSCRSSKMLIAICRKMSASSSYAAASSASCVSIFDFT